MADFNFITTRLATGAAVTSAEDVQALVDAGITDIIDCRAEFDDAALLAGHPALTYLWNGTPDDGQQKPIEWFQRSIDFALMALRNPKRKVYAHCAAGVNRGPSACYAIMRALGFSAQLARSLITGARPVTLNGIAYASQADAAVEQLGYV